MFQPAHSPFAALQAAQQSPSEAPWRVLKTVPLKQSRDQMSKPDWHCFGVCPPPPPPPP